MKIIDITKELLSSEVYPGDTPPVRTQAKSFDLDGCRLSDLNCCLHNGTHIDAPCHFVRDGCDVAGIPPESCFGECIVVSSPEAAVDAFTHYSRILLRGCNLSPETAEKLRGAALLGIESQSFGEGDNKGDVHRCLLGSGVVLLEGLDLSGAEDGVYLLSALPLKIAGSDGSPVRAILIKD